MGDGEVDKQRCNSELLERKSTWFNTFSKTASAVADTIISMLKPYQAHVHTITADNGTSLSNMNVLQGNRIHTVHVQNENSNEYVPKGSDLSVVTAEALSAVSG